MVAALRPAAARCACSAVGARTESWPRSCRCTRRRAARRGVIRLLGHGAADELGPVCDPGRPPGGGASPGRPARRAAVRLGRRRRRRPAGGPAVGAARLARRLVRRPSPAVRTDAIDLGGAARDAQRQPPRADRKARAATGGAGADPLPDRPTIPSASTPTSTSSSPCTGRAGGRRAARGRSPVASAFTASSPRSPCAVAGCGCASSSSTAARSRRSTTCASAARESNYQAGRDPALDRHSVGLLLHAQAIRETIADGLREYRFLRGGEAYKRRFADLDRGVETIARARGRRGARGAGGDRRRSGGCRARCAGTCRAAVRLGLGGGAARWRRMIVEAVRIAERERDARAQRQAALVGRRVRAADRRARRS